ncbi:DUF5305 domain-containing protein [Natrinema salsiterrestre]|uniref:DUF5305 family protein n=1 Tax=Natrinema salsiterrestre TaxID=2950540 RepID=A0A9Q4L3J9_9EURY|nr:DUF5305 family protein [Natrinema salsiterrestre]MDF9744686.1 DUF5305 family protein [Natrinema salsiterrestre]
MSGRLTETDAGTVDDERRLRSRVLLAEYRTAIIVALVVLVALGGWVSYGAYATPGEETSRQRTTAWTATGDVSHAATVTEPNTIYDEGTRLENDPLYYTAISPTVDGEFVAGYDARTSDDVQVGLTVDLVYRSVGSDNTTHWSERERLASTREANVQPGENVTAAFSVNVSEITARVDEIESDLEASRGDTEIELVLEREIDGTIAGERRSTADSYRLTIDADSGTYEIEDGESYDETHEEYETETVPASVSPIRSVGGPLLVVLGIGGLAGLGYVSRRVPTPTTAEREWLAYRDDRAEFEGVITTMRLPDAALEGPRGELETLSALAEFGIDVGSAIVFDPERDLYVVRGDGMVSVFEPPAKPPAAEAADDRISFADDSPQSSVTDGEPIVESGSDRPALSDASDTPPVTDERAATTDSTAASATDPDEASSADLAATSQVDPNEAPAPDSGAMSESDSAVEIDDDDLLGLAGLREEDLLEPAPLGWESRSENGSNPDEATASEPGGATASDSTGDD